MVALWDMLWKDQSQPCYCWSPEIVGQGPSGAACGFEIPHPHSDHPGNKWRVQLPLNVAQQGQCCSIYAQVTRHTSISTDCVGKQVGNEGFTRQIWLALLTHVGCSWWMNRSPWQLGIKCWVRIIPPEAAAESVLCKYHGSIVHSPNMPKKYIKDSTFSWNQRNGCHFGPKSFLAIP